MKKIDVTEALEHLETMILIVDQFAARSELPKGIKILRDNAQKFADEMRRALSGP